MQSRDVAAAARPSRRRIVGYNPSISGLTACGLVVVLLFSWAFAAGSSVDGELFGFLGAMCLLASMFCLLGTCRVVVDPAGFIDVIDPFVVRRVPVDELVRIEHHDGLHLRAVSGRRFGSVAYGASLLGHLLRYPRSVRAARRIEAAIGGLPDPGGVRAWRQDTVRSQPRVRAYLATAGVDAALVIGVLVQLGA